MDIAFLRHEVLSSRFHVVVGPVLDSVFLVPESVIFKPVLE